MCTMIAHQVQIMGRGKSGLEWFEVREANVSYDHPYDLPLEHALNIDFVNEALGPGARVAVELSVDAARQLVKTIEAVLAQADQRGASEPRGAGPHCAACAISSVPSEPHLFERRRPGIRVDQHQRRLFDAWPHAARPDVFPDRTEPHPLVDELLDLVQQSLAFAAIGHERLLPVERVHSNIIRARLIAVSPPTGRHGQASRADLSSGRRSSQSPIAVFGLEAAAASFHNRATRRTPRRFHGPHTARHPRTDRREGKTRV